MNILITGGASGLGEAITRKIAIDSSCKVYFTFNKSVTDADAIESDFANTAALKCNFTDKDELDELCNKIPQLNIDVLINNAYTGSFINTYFHKTPIDDFASGFNDNILPTIAITQAVINAFRKKKSGKIITILSAALVNTPPIGSSVYVANKAYLHELAKIWAVENAKYNITSNTISPSFMLTALTSLTDERIIEQIKSNHPLNKLLTTGEVAESVLFLMTASQQINGADLIINAAANIK